MSMTEAEIREALARAERATGGECIVRNRYSHGGGRMYREDGPARDLILDVYDEANREFYFSARTDVPRLAADLLAARTERDLALSLRNTATNVLADVVAHRDSLAARCRELEGALKPFAIAGVTNADMECERMWAHDPSMRVFLRPGDETTRCALVRFGDFDRAASLLGIEATVSWPQPPHTCQIHRATSGASDCGLSPCEEAKVHRDRGEARTATVRRAVPAVAEKHGQYCPKNPDATIRHMVDFCTCGPTPAETATPEAAKCATCDGQVLGSPDEQGEPFVPTDRPCPDCGGGA